MPEVQHWGTSSLRSVGTWGWGRERFWMAESLVHTGTLGNDTQWPPHPPGLCECSIHLYSSRQLAKVQCWVGIWGKHQRNIFKANNLRKTQLAASFCTSLSTMALFFLNGGISPLLHLWPCCVLFYYFWHRKKNLRASLSHWYTHVAPLLCLPARVLTQASARRNSLPESRGWSATSYLWSKWSA